MKAVEKVERQSIAKVAWYKKNTSEAVPVPILGPDVFDPRQIEMIREHTLGAGAARAAVSTGPARVLPQLLTPEQRAHLEEVRARFLAKAKQPA